MTFASLGLHAPILKAIEARGYNIPTPVQTQAIPPILAGKDVVASAQTGTGKTAAFVLPALHYLSQQPRSKHTRVLILTPTRELAAQITKAAMEYGKFLQFNIVNLVGGMPYHQQIRELARGADIIVATPGRLLDHMESKRVDLSHIQMLVLDEADRMLDMGFIEDVEYIADLTPEDRQTLLFSATMDKQLTTVVRHLLKHPVRVDLSQEKLTVPQIEQHAYKANSPQHKLQLLKHFLTDERIFKAIIFSATKINATKIADRLRDEGFAAAALHGDLRQNVRNRTVDQLRRGKIQFLVATDVAARGIDISDVTHVINYDLPRSSEDYVHRIGRTGRAGKSGVAISFVLPSDTRQLQRIERFIGQKLKLEKSAVEMKPVAGEPTKHQDSIIQYADRDDKPRRFDKSFKSDKPRRSDKPFRSDKDKSGRGEKRFDSYPSDKSSRHDRPFKSDKSSRHERPFKSKKPSRHGDSFKSDKPSERKTAFRSERASRYDTPFKSEKSSRHGDSFRSDKPSGRKPFRSEKGSRYDAPFKSEKSSRHGDSFRSDKPSGRKPFRSEKGPRRDAPFKSDKPSRHGESFKAGKSSDRKTYFRAERTSRHDRPPRDRDAAPFKKPFGKPSGGKPRAAAKKHGRADEPYRKRSSEE